MYKLPSLTHQIDLQEIITYKLTSETNFLCFQISIPKTREEKPGHRIMPSSFQKVVVIIAIVSMKCHEKEEANEIIHSNRRRNQARQRYKKD